MTKPMTDERRKEIEKLAHWTHVGFGEKEVALRECLQEIDRLNRARNQEKKWFKGYTKLEEELERVEEENRQARELLSFAAGLLEVEYEDDGVAEWQIAYREWKKK